MKLPQESGPQLTNHSRISRHKFVYRGRNTVFGVIQFLIVNINASTIFVPSVKTPQELCSISRVRLSSLFWHRIKVSKRLNFRVIFADDKCKAVLIRGLETPF